jgi:hypothetical protein
MKIKTNRLIQTTFCLFVSILLCYIGNAQLKDKALNKIYLQSGTGGASNSGFVSELGIQSVFKNKWIATLSYHNIDMEPKNLPKDYDPGEVVIILIPIPGETPGVDMRVISLTMGKFFKGRRNTWFTTEAGLSVVNSKKLNFSKNDASSPNWIFPLFGETPANYVFTEEKKSTIGAMFKADVNWAFASFAGLGAGVFANFNSIQSPVGLQIKLIVGKMNREKRK